MTGDTDPDGGLASAVEGLVHEPTQTDGGSVDLTVASVARVTDPGRVDFGGGELEPATTAAVPTERRNPDDDYGWWTLADDVYLLSYNESLAAPATDAFRLATRPALRRRGAFHPTVHLDGGDDLDGVPLAVAGGGVRIKENARVSTLRRA